MNILDNKYSLKQVRHNIEMFFIILILFIGLIIICSLLAIYIGTAMGYEKYNSLNNNQSVYFGEFQDHRIDTWS